MKFTVVGTGYVGLSIATLLAINNKVEAVDINTKRVELIRIATIIEKVKLLILYLFTKLHPLNFLVYKY